jgi:hypothetical protein
MHSLVTLALLGLIGWGVWQACQARSIFVIRIEGGHPRVLRGTVTRAFLNQISELCHHHGITRGTVLGRVRGSQISLELKGPFPPACRQQMRNMWVVSGWSAGRTKTRRGGSSSLA